MALELIAFRRVNGLFTRASVHIEFPYILVFIDWPGKMVNYHEVPGTGSEANGIVIINFNLVLSENQNVTAGKQKPRMGAFYD